MTRRDGPPVRPRPEVLAVRPYVPPLEERRGCLRLDFNENTLGCSPKVLRTLRRLDAEAIATYPEYGRLRRALAAHFAVPEDHVLATGGIDEALHLLVLAFIERGDVVVTPSPGFVMHRVYPEMAGATVRMIPSGEDLAFPEHGVLRALRGARLLVLASPNNPTGAAVPLAAIRRLLRANRRCLVAIDEAYFDFHGVTALPLLRTYANLVVLRTFSKAYGLAGLRLGCAIARPPVIDCLARVRSPYSVNGLAAILAETALRDTAFVRRYTAEVRLVREFLRHELARRGISTWPSAANFVLARIGPAAADFQDALRADGILVRDQSAQPGLDGCVRIGVGTRPQVLAFLTALDRWQRRPRRKTGA
jgi:histidinol-phosphate aminotransferase